MNPMSTELNDKIPEIPEGSDSSEIVNSKEEEKVPGLLKRFTKKVGSIFEKEDPEEIDATYAEALKILQENVNPYFGNLKNLIKFKDLPDSKVGESTSKGDIFIDPIMLKHSASRLAAVILHEVLHKNNTIPNEGLVEAMRQKLLDTDMEASDEYKEQIAGFMEFVKVYGGGEIEEKPAIEEIYGLYDKSNFYQIYYNLLSRVGNDKDKALKMMDQTFPELEIKDSSIRNLFSKVTQHKH